MRMEKKIDIAQGRAWGMKMEKEENKQINNENHHKNFENLIIITFI